MISSVCSQSISTTLTPDNSGNNLVDTKDTKDKDGTDDQFHTHPDKWALARIISKTMTNATSRNPGKMFFLEKILPINAFSFHKKVVLINR
jgi:hypothetical protein